MRVSYTYNLKELYSEFLYHWKKMIKMFFGSVNKPETGAIDTVEFIE